MTDYSERFLLLRKKLGLTQDEMAQRIGYSRNYYSELERGARPPEDKILHTLHLEEMFQGIYHSDHKRVVGIAEIQHEKLPSIVQKSRGTYHAKRLDNQYTESNRDNTVSFASSYGPEQNPRPQPTRQQIEAYLVNYLNAAEQSEGGLGYAWHVIKRNLRSEDFTQDES